MAPADDPLADLSAEEQRALVELAQARADGRVNRRDVLAGGAGMAVGAAGLASLTGGGSAQPTGDEGSVGTQGNRVEAWISEADALEVDTDKSNSAVEAASFKIRTDGSNIVAEPQDNPFGPSMARVTGTDIGTVLTDVITNQLPPQGTTREATGTITLKRGEYPGTLSQVPLAMGLTIEGESVTHYTSENLAGRYETVPATVLNGAAGTEAFVNPNTGNGAVTFIELRNLDIIGPGNDSAGSKAIADPNSDLLDWVRIDNCVIQSFENVIDINALDNVFQIRNSHVLDFGNGGSGRAWDVIGGKSAIINTNFFTENHCDAMAKLRASDALIKGASSFTLGPNAPDQPSNGYVNLEFGRQQYVGDGTKFVNNLGSGGGGMLRINNAEARIIGCQFRDKSAGSNLNGVFDTGGGRSVVLGCGFQGPMLYSINVSGAGARSAYVYNNDDGQQTNDSINLFDSPDVYVHNPGMQGSISEGGTTARVRYANTAFVTSSPSAGNYTAADAGVKIVNTNASPPDVYYVQNDGTLTSAT